MSPDFHCSDCLEKLAKKISPLSSHWPSRFASSERGLAAAGFYLAFSIPMWVQVVLSCDVGLPLTSCKHYNFLGIHAYEQAAKGATYFSTCCGPSQWSTPLIMHCCWLSAVDVSGDSSQFVRRGSSADDLHVWRPSWKVAAEEAKALAMNSSFRALICIVHLYCDIE